MYTSSIVLYGQIMKELMKALNIKIHNSIILHNVWFLNENVTTGFELSKGNWLDHVKWVLQIRIEPDVNESLQWKMEDYMEVEVKFILKMTSTSLILLMLTGMKLQH